MAITLGHEQLLELSAAISYIRSNDVRPLRDSPEWVRRIIWRESVYLAACAAAESQRETAVYADTPRI